MKKALKIVLITLLVIVVILLLIGGYFGFVPGVSTIFGSNKPRDLGITYTEQDRLNGRARLGWQLQELPPNLAPEESLKYSGQRAVTASFNNKELTAWINKSWKYILLTDAQIRVNPDGTVEASGILHPDRMEDYAKAMGASGETKDLINQYGKYLIGNPAIYMKAGGTVVNNTVINARVYELQIGRYSVPANWLAESQDYFIQAAEWQIKSIPGLSIKSLSFQNGSANFDGTVPAIIARTIG